MFPVLAEGASSPCPVMLVGQRGSLAGRVENGSGVELYSANSPRQHCWLTWPGPFYYILKG